MYADELNYFLLRVFIIVVVVIFHRYVKENFNAHERQSKNLLDTFAKRRKDVWILKPFSKRQLILVCACTAFIVIIVVSHHQAAVHTSKIRDARRRGAQLCAIIEQTSTKKDHHRYCCRSVAAFRLGTERVK